MLTKEKLYTSVDFWFAEAQTDLYNQVIDYMEREQINKTELSQRLKVSKGYISQILNGESNFSMRKLIEISLALGLVPNIRYESLEHLINSDSGSSKVVDFYDWTNEELDTGNVAEPERNYIYSNPKGIATSLKLKSAPHKLIKAS